MPRLFARIVACFIFSREKRRAFRERHCVKKETPLSRVERKLDILTRAFLLEKTAPGVLAALCPPFPPSGEMCGKLRDQLWANLGENGDLRRQMIALQAELLRESVYVAPEAESAARLRGLLEIARDSESELMLADTLSWIYRRRERYAEAAGTLVPLFARDKTLPPKLLLRLILCENRCGNTERAEDLTRIYLQRFGTRDLWRQCDLAELAEKCGARGTELSAAAKLAARARKSISEKFFERLLDGKSVAVVGNSPQEIGRGNGAKIDAHDIVIRFNDFPESPEFQRDYGSKTDVWACACWTKTAWREHVPAVIASDILYSDEYPDIEYVRRAAGTPQTVLAVPLDFYQKILAESGIKLPTTGALLLAWIKTLKPDFSAEDVFGFSFTEKTPPPRLDHYYRSDSAKNGTIHDLNEERAFLRKVFGLDPAQ